MPIDGAALCRVLHERGINLRYLGQFATAINQSEEKDRLRHIRVGLTYTPAGILLDEVPQVCLIFLFQLEN